MEKNREAAGNQTQASGLSRHNIQDCIRHDIVLFHSAVRGPVAVGGHSSVVRALVAQARDLGLLPDSFPHPLFSLCKYLISLLILDHVIHNIQYCNNPTAYEFEM